MTIKEVSVMIFEHYHKNKGLTLKALRTSADNLYRSGDFDAYKVALRLFTWIEKNL